MAKAAALAPATSAAIVPVRTGPRGRHVVDTTLLFAPTSGGVRRYLLAKHRWLRRHSRLKHTIVVPGRKDSGLPYGVISFGSPPLPFAGGYRIPLRLKLLRQQLARLTPDLIEAGDPYHVGWQALQVARERRIPAVAFCHSDLIATSAALLGDLGRRAASRYLCRLYAGFDLVLAPSAGVAGRLAAAGLRNVQLQPLGVDVASLTPALRSRALRVELGIPWRTRLLVFAGRNAPEKRVGDLLAAAARLGPRHHLLLVGARRAGRPSANVTVLPYQHDQQRLARILASCDAFVHAGDQETFGLVVLEAMACGLPVIAARAGALTELVDDSVGATFRPRDPADLARTVEHVFDRDMGALRRAARRRAEAFSWDRSFTLLLGRYTRLMSAAPAVEPGSQRRAG